MWRERKTESGRGPWIERVSCLAVRRRDRVPVELLAARDELQLTGLHSSLVHALAGSVPTLFPR
jgi:hypothetical protein